MLHTAVESPPATHSGVQRPRRIAGWPLGLAFVVFAAEAVALQYASNAFQADYAAVASDEAAHFVTALMVRDFLASDQWWHPWQFARDYYLHYPKVAMGHWPPGLYAALGPWLLVAGTSRTAALLFMALLAAATATVTFVAGAALVAPWAGWLAGALFLALPLTQEATGQVMSELAVGLLMLLATLQCGRAIARDSWRDWARFGILSSAAILTSGSGWALALVPPLALVLSARVDLARSRRMWSSAAIVVGLCAPWYLATQGIRASEGAFTGGGLAFVGQALVAFPVEVAVALGPVLAVLAALGLYVRLAAPFRHGRIDATWAALAALPAAKAALHVLIPAGFEARYMLAGMPALLLFAATGTDWAARRVTAGPRQLATRIALAMLAFGWIGVQVATRDSSYGDGYGRAAEAVTGPDGPAPLVCLVASDSRGEGSWIAAVAPRETRPSSIVLRGSKVFGAEDWLGRSAGEVVRTSDDVLGILDRVLVNVVIVDTTTAPEESRTYHATLAAAVSSSPAWERTATFPLLRQGRRTEDGLLVYRRRQPAMGTPDMELIAGIVLRDGIR